MDVYIVMCGGKIMGVSARLQGAELIRSDYADHEALMLGAVGDPDERGRAAYDSCTIETHRVQDLDD